MKKSLKKLIMFFGAMSFIVSSLIACEELTHNELYNEYLYKDNITEENDEFNLGPRALIAGYVTRGCNFQKSKKIKQAHDVLWETIDTDWGDFLDCMANAPSVEFSCHKKMNPIKAALSLRNFNRYTTVKCKNLDPNVAAQAYLDVTGNNLDMDHDFINNNTPRRIAAVIAHEIMHNRGYSHSKNDFGSTYYKNTIPEQIEACIQFSGVSNSSKGSKSVTWNDEFCNGPKTGNHVSRRGMHACPVGTYMAGVRLDSNEFLCSAKPNYNYSTNQEIIRKRGGYSEFSMANCPKGYAMTGFHESKNYLLCAPYRQSQRRVDKSTSRAGMHTCPKNKVMTGIHVKKNDLTCQY